MPRRPSLRLLIALVVQAGLLAVCAGALAGSVRRGSLDVASFWHGLRTARGVPGSEAVLLAVVLGGALVAGAMTTIGTAATLALRVAPSLHLLTVLSRLALPALRGLAPLGAAASLTLAPAPAFAVAAERDHGVLAQQFESDAPVVREPATNPRGPAPNVPVPRTADGTPARDRPPPPDGTNPAAALRTDGPFIHVVVPGDHLWGIAASHLRALDVEPGEPRPSSVARYWSLVITANRAALRSGDPSLIFPGETIVLPPLDRAS